MIGQVQRALILVAVSGVSSATVADLSPTIFTITAESNGLVGSWTADSSLGQWIGDEYTWDLPSAISITTTTGETVAELQTASIFVKADPVVSINFNVVATQANTVFSVTAPVLSFPTINTAVGQASAGITLTDLNGDGATLTPNPAGAYQSVYNGAFPGGTTFANLLNAPVSVGAFGTTNVNENFPGGNAFVPIAGSIFDMSARWQFTLTPGDLASGTGVFVVVPSPASAIVLGFGGLFAVRRRR